MEAHNQRAAFCPCDRCVVKREMVRRDALEDTPPMIFNFNARQLGVYLQMSLEYRKGAFD